MMQFVKEMRKDLFNIGSFWSSRYVSRHGSPTMQNKTCYSSYISLCELSLSYFVFTLAMCYFFVLFRTLSNSCCIMITTYTSLENHPLYLNTIGQEVMHHWWYFPHNLLFHLRKLNRISYIATGSRKLHTHHNMNKDTQVLSLSEYIKRSLKSNLHYML